MTIVMDLLDLHALDSALPGEWYLSGCALLMRMHGEVMTCQAERYGQMCEEFLCRSEKYDELEVQTDTHVLSMCDLSLVSLRPPVGTEQLELCKIMPATRDEIEIELRESDQIGDALGRDHLAYKLKNGPGLHGVQAARRRFSAWLLARSQDCLCPGPNGGVDVHSHGDRS